MPASKEAIAAALEAARTAWAAVTPPAAFDSAVAAAADAAYEAGLKTQILACHPDDLVIVAVSADWTREEMQRLSSALDDEPKHPRILCVTLAVATKVPNGQLAYQAGEEAATAKLRARFLKMLDQHPGGRS